ncbi:transcriptional regulator, ArsR family/methyltransferase, UbiE/COQ5 family [Hyphomonas neptunium ATCC 15444]|uniref:Transcriptional regulator, ArsR family/methyltransferase, UbiE/COQ5 family n=2 Tax=Hyphomonas TaxID=85 RepID=Q0C0E2_HYPNA|nr:MULTISPECIES: metalloregulator ArsR/SmtB family transcription factor [Hyphomonas]ABI77878.1 transcriptional regulator, ArsR family/methyltransferase, UbiE/COQ5 family [Hyphomonas neptunium ATCC 15444]
MSDAFDGLLERLRAAGEPTRLRLLALLRYQDLSVGELVQVLEQSQPRLSHHLKALSEAGLAERLPEGAFVFYRAARSGPGKDLLDALFAALGSDVPETEADLERLHTVMAGRAASAEAYFSSIAETWDTVRGLHYPNEAIETALLELAGKGPFRRLIDFGTGTGRMLALFAPLAAEAEGIDFSHRMLTVARANLESAGARNARVRFGNVTAVPFADASADLVIIHQVLHFLDTPGDAITEAGRVLAPGGQLLVTDFAPHDLEFLRAEHGHHRLGVRHDALAGWAAEAGLSLEKPLSFAPPENGAPGLTVNIWRALKPASVQEKAA